MLASRVFQPALRNPARTMSTLASKLRDPSLLASHAYVGGKWVSAGSGRTYPIVNPATGETVATNPVMDGSDTRLAIEAAHKVRLQGHRTVPPN